jgi:phosphatidylethanolamine/phosphatidyl-N-methylethanolamine N-methyltransferase
MMRGTDKRRALTERFDDEIRFFKGWIDKPKAVGSVVPTSSVTARKMASVIDCGSGLPVLELGAGTGVITKAIIDHGVKPQDLFSVEYAADFVDHLRTRFPAVNILHGDAFDLDTVLSAYPGMMFDAVVSGVPLLNFPVQQRIDFVEQVLDRLPDGRPLVQITYGPLSPVPPRRGNYTVKHLDFIVRNLPPAQLWLYRRPLKS